MFCVKREFRLFVVLVMKDVSPMDCARMYDVPATHAFSKIYELLFPIVRISNHLSLIVAVASYISCISGLSWKVAWAFSSLALINVHILVPKKVLGEQSMFLIECS